MEPNNLYPNNIHDTDSALVFLAAGAATAIITQTIGVIWKLISKKIKKASRFQHLCLELSYNLKTIQESLDKLNDLEKHILAKNIDKYITNFQFHKVITITLNEMYLDKTLYAELTLKELQGLQVFASLYTAGTDLDIRGKVEYYRQAYKTDPNAYSLMLLAIEVWKKQLTESKDAVEEVFIKLARKYRYKIKE